MGLLIPYEDKIPPVENVPVKLMDVSAGYQNSLKAAGYSLYLCHRRHQRVCYGRTWGLAPTCTVHNIIYIYTYAYVKDGYNGMWVEMGTAQIYMYPKN